MVELPWWKGGAAGSGLIESIDYVVMFYPTFFLCSVTYDCPIQASSPRRSK
jgi:hypothetical protein